MNETMQTLQADIGFLKAVAEEGRTTPVLGGSILVAAGAVYGVASLLHWAILTGLIAAPPWAFAVVWFGATVLFLGVLRLLDGRLSPAKSRTTANRVAGLAWQGVGWTIFALVASTALVSWRANSAIPTLLLPSVILALYGLGWSVVAAVSRTGWIWLTAASAYAGAIIVAAFCTSPAVFLMFAAALVLLAIAPGVTLMRQARAAA